MKLLVKTTGNFMLKDLGTGDEIDNVRPSVVRSSGFIQSRIAIGQISIISADLREEATDTEFAKFWADSDRKEDLAVESFLSAFPKEPEPEQEPEAPEAPKEPIKGKLAKGHK